MMAEKEFVEGTRVDVDGNETPMYMDRDMGAEEGFKVIAVRTCCQEHRWRRGPFWLNSFWTDVWDWGIYLVIVAVILTAIISSIIIFDWMVAVTR
jgi:hypothetical protein